MSGYSAGYGDVGVTGYEDPNAVAGYGVAAGEARLVYLPMLRRATRVLVQSLGFFIHSFVVHKPAHKANTIQRYSTKYKIL